jgi:galactokinase
LPAAIDKAAYIVITPRKDQEIHLHSVDLHEDYTTTVAALAKSEEMSWPNYILGVIQQFILAGIAIGGFDAALTGDIPIGAGLSSSAAVECAVALALNKLYAAGLDKFSMVKLAQRAENEFVGVQCGIMDQFASMFGKHNHVIRLDCRSLEFEYVPFNMDGIKILLLDTNVKHSLGSSEYNVRRKQCETGVAWIQRHVPEVKSLRDATVEMLDKYVLNDDLLIYQRCKYVVEENNRLLAACQDLEQGDIPAFGARMYQSHHGLSKLYEVSCPELDFLVTHVQDNPAVLGARMMGGGFGGCTINLVKEDAIEALVSETTVAYKKSMNKVLKAHVAKIETGSNLLS